MSHLKQFEGPDVRALLDRIYADYGSEPTIARAETFRTGGFLGFFQRENYRLVVEGEPAPQGAPEPTVDAGKNFAVHAVDPFAFLAESTEDSVTLGFQVAPAAAQVAGPEELVKEDLDRQAEGAAPVAEGAAPVAEGAAPVAEGAAPVAEGAAPVAEGAALENGAAQIPASGPSFQEVLQRVADLVVEQPAGAELPEAPPLAPPAGAERPEAPPLAPPAGAEPSPAATSPGGAGLRALMQIGFEQAAAERIEAAAAAGTLEGGLLSVLGSMPAAPRLPSRPGSLVVVVGTGRRAFDEAARVAADVGTDPAAVAYAAKRRPSWAVLAGLAVRHAEDAAELAPGHRRGRVGVVAVDAPLGRSSVWARRVISALRPTLVIGVVDAMHKNEDIEAWFDSLGGVDALVVDNVETTVSPACVLRLDVPVCRLGDHTATPARWVAVILDRLAPAE
jgi:hypothetical protein